MFKVAKWNATMLYINSTSLIWGIQIVKNMADKL